jgi:hypothetical protein
MYNVHFKDRREFLYDAEVFHRKDSTVALKIYEEYIRAHSPFPYPIFFEVNRENQKLDPLWHMPIDTRVKFDRELPIPVLNMHEKPKWNVTKLGLVPQRFDRFLIAHNTLESLDYFPLRGDQIYWNGYRYTILRIVLEPDAYWHQTNVWMGLTIEAIVPPEGDARPIPDKSTLAPSERSSRP